MKHRAHAQGYRLSLNIKLFFLIGLVLSLLFSLVPVKADWEDDANARIEANRKRDVQLTIVDVNGLPLNNVDIVIEQIDHKFGFGAALAYGLLSSNSTYRDFVLDHFNWAVCENEMKWGSNESTRDSENYTQADYMADWCADNNLVFRGHCIMWEQNNDQMPSWLKTLGCAEMVPEVNERVNSIVSRYAGQIVNWDVDNEMLSDDFFGSCLGDQGRADVFALANSIDPNCGMYMNEYWGNSFGGYDGDEYVARANNLISLGAPVEGLGIQAHVNSPFDPERYYTDLLTELDDMGLPIVATEFDTDATNATQVADDLENFYRICFSHPNVEAIMMWGIEQSAWRWDGVVNSSTWVLTQAGVRYEALLDEWTTSASDTTEPNGISLFRGFHGTYEITLTIGEEEVIYEIELEPGTGTAEYVLQMDVGPPDTTPPSPDPMAWAVDGEPNAVNPTSITMTAATATDDNPPIEYYFECTTDSDANSGWQTNSTYVAQGLESDTQYTFRVKARDDSANQNETAFSSTASATTYPPDLTPPTPNPMQWDANGEPNAISSTKIMMTAATATDALTPPVEYYFECTTDGDANSTWQSNSTYIAEGLEPLTQYTFRVKARDSAPALNETAFSGTASATTQEPPTEVQVLGDWVTGTTHSQESGSERAFVVIAHAESNWWSTPALSGVTYGGQTMTKIADNVQTGTWQTKSYVGAFILDEDGIDAATSDTISASWSGTSSTSLTSVFLEGVDQDVLIGDYATNGVTNSGTLTTSALETAEGDMVILGATCTETGTYTSNNGFAEDIDLTVANFDGTDAHKVATGADETPSVTHSTSTNRQSLIGFVVQISVPVGDLPPDAPTGLVATAGNDLVSLDWNDNTEGDLAGYNVYRSLTQGSGYGQLNGSLVLDSNYVDNTANNFTPYYYVVTAVDANANESGYSNEDTATPDIYQTCSEVQLGGYGLISDLTGDCYVDLNDLNVIVAYWLDDDCGSSNNCDGADFDPTDGDVDWQDFSDFAVDWMLCNKPGQNGCIKNWWP